MRKCYRKHAKSVHYNKIDGVYNIRAVLPVLFIPARQPAQQETTRNWYLVRFPSAHQIHSVTVSIKFDSGANCWLWIRLGGSLLHREEQTSHIQVSTLQLYGRHAHAQGNTQRTAEVLMISTNVIFRIRWH